MKKRKVKIILSTVALITIFIGGCERIDNNSSKEKANHVYKMDEDANDSGLKITFKESKLLKAEDAKTDVLQVNFDLENTTAEKKGFTAIELEVKNADGQTLEVYPGENYGKEILPGKKDTGSGYFTNQGNGPYKVIYKNESSNKVLTWDLIADK